jgi:hypothetical protein
MFFVTGCDTRRQSPFKLPFNRALAARAESGE